MTHFSQIQAFRGKRTVRPQTFQCPHCLDKKYIETVIMPDGETIQLAPSEPAAFQIHQIVRAWAIEHGANSDDPWGVSNKDAPKWPQCNVRVVVETCDCLRTDAINSHLQQMLQTGEVPPKFHDKTFETWLQMPEYRRDGLEPMFDKCVWFANTDDKPEADGKFGLVLSGPPGIGKTSLAVCVLMQRAKRGQSVLFFDFNDLVMKARSANRPESELRYEDIVKAAATVQLLLLDDMGDFARKTNITDFTRELVYDILRKRFDSLKETIITTNLTEKQFQDMFEKRIYRRVNGDDGMCYWLSPTSLK